MNLTLADVARCLSGMAEEGYEKTVINSVQTDSRTVDKGDLFVCIDGDNFDGHEFAAKAIKAGAVAVVVSRIIDAVDVPTIMVRNTTEALGKLAACWRDMCGAQLIAVTGTAGKTTVKEMLAAVASQKFNVAKNYRNFNNQIGLPISMLKATVEQDLWIMELGISRQGDMEELAPIASPDIAVITNIGPGHLEGLGNEAGVAQAKTAMLKYLRQSGSAIISRDYPLLWDAAREIVDAPIGFSVCTCNHTDSPAATQQSCDCDQSDTSYVASFLGGSEKEGWGHFRLRTPRARVHSRPRSVANTTPRIWPAWQLLPIKSASAGTRSSKASKPSNPTRNGSAAVPPVTHWLSTTHIMPTHCPRLDPSGRPKKWQQTDHWCWYWAKCANSVEKRHRVTKNLGN